MSSIRTTLCCAVLFVSCLGCTLGVESAAISARVCERVTVRGPGIGAVIQARRTSVEIGAEALMSFEWSEESIESVNLFNVYVGGNVEYGDTHRILAGVRFQRDYASHWLDTGDTWSRQAGEVDSVVARLGYAIRLKRVLWGADFLWSHSIYDLNVSWFDRDYTMVRLRLVVPLEARR